jgi:hypothetical protein
MHGTVKTLSDLLHLHCGTASQIIFHTQMLQHKAAFRKKQQVKKIMK